MSKRPAKPVVTAASVAGVERLAGEIAANILRAANIHPEVRNSNSLDFHELSVLQLRQMLSVAFFAGRASAAIREG